MTLPQINDSFFSRLAEKLPKTKRRRFFAGVKAISLKRFISLNATGRALTLNEVTGLSRIWRMITDKQLPQSLQ